MNRISFATSMLGALGAATVTAPRIARAADEFPSRPITLIVPWGPGGGSDQVGRAVAKSLQDVLKGTSVPVINVPGADGNDGMVKLVNGDADGYTMAVFIVDTFVGNMTSKSTAAWHMSDITPLAVMNRQPYTYFVSSTGPYKSWADVEKAAKTTQIKIAIDGFGSCEDLLTKFLARKGVKLTVIPFAKPGERYAALLGNQVDLLTEPDGNLRRYIEGSQMRPVMVFDAKRVPQMPGVPTAIELGFNVAPLFWRSFVVKAGTDPRIVSFLSDAMARVYKSADYQQFMDYTWSAKDSYVAAKDVPAFLHRSQQQIEEIEGTQ
jgi:tripartite-type tricarboxylate transporter receptor subunit TctC